MYPRIILLVSALFASNVSSAAEFNIQLGSDTARFMYLTEAFGQDFGRLELEAGFLYNENSDKLLNAGLLVRGESVSVPLIVSIGGRAYYAEVASYKLGAIAIGGDLLLSPESWGGFGLGAFFYTAPGIVSFSDAEGLTEYGVYTNFQVTPQARMSLGYKKINVSIKNAADAEIDKGAYFGLNISF
ncbi:MAG: YfaZ family outer membrane protein [Gammaproteobacteria bacterium]|nr:YfaZ family outer membrane protein [Gammaproteobacteria bacterium]MCW8986964.1 YfaZ family outer membrane protein [Gammaproteobacteria bacterium]MCW9032224.1 YfaZ family outer membrane protein [Gammaproteobacteria bacterium]